MSKASKQCRILIVEPETIVRLHLQQIVEEMGHEVVAAVSGSEEAHQAVAEHQPQVVFLDVALSQSGAGSTLLEDLRRQDPHLSAVFITADTGVETMQRAQEVRALGYVVKPFNRLEIQSALEQSRQRHGSQISLLQHLPKTASHPHTQNRENEGFGGLLGKSAAMQRVFREARLIAGVDWSVLIEGETGTGKELVARAVHATSHRASHPFVTVHCGGLPEATVSSRMFGHRRGSFAGAISDQTSLFESANGGTLFIDEISDLPWKVQKSLLRVLEERSILRLGDTRTRPIDVRLIAATNKNLAEEVSRGRFRADLLFRLRVARLQMPALRHQPEDIELLTKHFVAMAASAAQKHIRRIHPRAAASLRQYDWPGNVRELKSAIAHAVLHCDQETLELRDLPPEIAHAHVGPAARIRQFSPFDEKARILSALDQCAGNRTLAAKMIGVSRATLYRRMTRFGIPHKS